MFAGGANGGVCRRIAVTDPLVFVQCSNDTAAGALVHSVHRGRHRGLQLRSISETIASLAALKKQFSGQPDAAAPFDNLSTLDDFGFNPGALRARFYIPENLRAGSPLVVVLHGCTQTAAAYDHHTGWSRLAEGNGFALLYPEQQRSNNPNSCFNWFQPADATRGSGEALSIRQMVEAMVRTHRLDPNRVFVTGLSAGGAMAAVMLATYPDVFAAGAIIAGLPYASATSIPEALSRMRGDAGPSAPELQKLIRRASGHRGPWPRISIWHGFADRIVAPGNAEALAAQWREVHAVSSVPTRSEKNGRRTRQIWCNAAGEILIETNMIAGMGHGTPLGNDGLGAPGPYALDVGVSSTREIALSWGIADAAAEHSPEGLATAAGERTGRPRLETMDPPASSDNRSAPPHAASAAAGVEKVIEKALRAAGLMR
jgi:poly(hydroxyalkanoate) depolymerase family esterase